MKPFRLLLLATSCLCGAAFAAAAEEARKPAELEPYQLVRSLQLVQDRIAGGDHAALPMQRKLLELTDRRLLATDPALFGERRNLRGLLVYAMSGGNPKTVASILSRIGLEGEDAATADAILDYVSGRPAEARRAFLKIDPKAVEPELGAFLALVRGSLVALEKPADALPDLDYARLLAPGTLVEEAALRRTISIAQSIKNRDRFLRAAEQYVRRFLRSPYASQFAEAFVAGIIAFARELKTDDIQTIVSEMTPEQQKVVYLRIARFAAIENMNELSAFASGKAMALNAGGPDPRATLYSSMSSVTSGTVEDVLAELRTIDRAKLSAGDRKLLEAAEAIALGVLSQPAAGSESSNGASFSPLAASSAEDGKEPPPAAAVKEPVTLTASPPQQAPAAEAAASTIEEARRRIDAIDALLREDTN